MTMSDQAGTSAGDRSPPVRYAATTEIPAATAATAMLVIRCENRSASQASGIVNSIGSTSTSTARHDASANQRNRASTPAQITHASHGFAAAFVCAEKPSSEPKIAGPMVTMASTAESTHRPKSDAEIGTPASKARVMIPSNAPGATPARSATIQSGEITSWYRSSD